MAGRAQTGSFSPGRFLDWIGALSVLLAAGIYWAAFLKDGAPFVYHPDEPAIVARAIRMVWTGDPDPRWFHYPSLYIYLQAAIADVVHRATSVPLSAGATILFDGAPPEAVTFYEWGRAATITFALGTTLLVVRMASELGGRWVGIFSGLLFTSSELVLESAVHVTVDMPMTFFVTLGTFLLMRLIAAPRGSARTSSYLLVAALGGLAGGTKYNGCLFLPALALLVLLHRGGLNRGAVLGILSCAVVAIAAFAVTTPYFLLDPGKFWDAKDGLPAEFHHYAEGHLGADTGTSAVKAAAVIFRAAGPFTVLSLFGVLRPDRAAPSPMRAQTALLLVVAVLFGAPVAVSRVFFQRNCLPLMPIVATLAGSGLAAVFEVIQASTRERPKARLLSIAPGIALFGLLLLFAHRALAPPLRKLRLMDTRTAAQHWIEGHVPAGSSVLREAFTPHVHLLPAFDVTSVFSVGAIPIARIVDDYDYVITSSEISRAAGISPKSSYAAIFARPPAYVSPSDGSERGPTIRVDRLRPELPPDLESRLVYRMSAEDGFADVYPAKDVQLELPEPGRAGPLSFEASDDDPSLLLPGGPFAGEASLLLRIVLYSPRPTTLQVFYQTTEERSFDEARSVRVRLVAGRNEKDIRFGPATLESPIRLDPGQTPGRYEIRLLSLYRL